MKRALSVFLAFLPAAFTAACSSTLSDNEVRNLAAPGPPPADYRKTIREIPNELIGGAEVSELRKAVAPQLYDWMTCVKVGTKPNISFYAVFFEGEKIKDIRRSVAIDRCEFEDYSPLTPSVSPPAKRRKVSAKTPDEKH